MSLAGYYDQSYPPSVLGFSSGATAGIPGSFTPSGSRVPNSVAELSAGNPVTVTASPATAWTTGQYVQTGTVGIPGRATWSGTAWVGGVAPLDEPEPEPEPEPETYSATPIAPEDIPEEIEEA